MRIDFYLLDRFRRLLHPILLKMMPGRRNFSLKILNEMPDIQGNKIYVMNHSSVHDAPIACEAIKDHFYILVGKQSLEIIDRIFFVLNGIVYMDRKDKKSRKKSFEKMFRILQWGKSLLIYPEGTWNMTPSKPMLPFNWGVIELAKLTGVPIVPVIAEYYPDCCFVMFGDAIYIESHADKKQSIEQLEDIMATMKWAIWSRFPVEARREQMKDEFEQMIRKRLEEYPKFDLEYEKSVVRKLGS